ncbi:hypothetical protein [Winogradskyella sp. PG-2]|uniref:hypothetical protein n=1 Tax=Winogradskyella sp. PG-2 TaxID=754409 RepID=UPI00045866A4|nr:hypothetical protein [Winogradskyella sp. PG-2]BAO75689.1 hypothetical protein WPG_1459 [Winogradskyella sp. PG-2]
MYWLIGIIIVFALAFVIIKLTINSKENPDSSLGILEHSSTFKKQDIEMVDDSLKNDTPGNLFNNK